MDQEMIDECIEELRRGFPSHIPPKYREGCIENLRRGFPSYLHPECHEKLLPESEGCTENPRESDFPYTALGVEHVVGAPLIEIHYVTVHTNKDLDGDEEPLELYGVIEVTNGIGYKLCLYNQPEDDTDMLDPGDRLVLIDTVPVTSLFPVSKIHIHLMDKSRGLELANGTLCLDFKEKKISLEESVEAYVTGKDGFVKVGYTIFEAAVVAFLNLILQKKDDHCGDDGSGCPDIPIIGEISASYKSKYSFAKGICAQLVSAELDDPLLVKAGTPIPLYKSILAVPAYSCLKIDIRLQDIVDGNAIDPARKIGFFTKEIKGSNGYFIEVNIGWRPGNPTKEMERPRMELSDDDVDGGGSPLGSFLYKLPAACNLKPELLTEVFSIIVLPDEELNTNEVLKLYGEIEFYSSTNDVYFFKRDESCPESFPRGKGKALMLEGPHKYCFLGARPAMRVELKDIWGHVFCKGVLCWCEADLNHPRIISFFNRRLCSIIPGEYGLVKVHYSIFENAMQATVMVLFSFDHSSREFNTKVSGNIVASYGGYDYTQYEKEYYQSVLFWKSLESPLKLPSRRKIRLPLLKSKISVPKDSFFIIEVDLCASLEVKKPGNEALKGEAIFKVGGECCWRLKKKNFFIDVFVDWDGMKDYSRCRSRS